MTAPLSEKRPDCIAGREVVQEQCQQRCVGLLLYGALMLAVPHALAADPTRGTTVFRCGDTYSDRPCADGRALHIDDSRDDAQRNAAAAVAIRQAALASQMMGDRQQAEASLARPSKSPPGRKTGTGTTAAPSVGSRTTGQSRHLRTSARRQDETDDFVAFVPRPPKAPKPAKPAQ